MGAVAGLKVGDAIIGINGEPPVAIADFQWVLHLARPAGDRVQLTVDRDGETAELELVLEPGWRRLDTISWRATTWALRRMVTGGLVLEAADDVQRKAAGLEADGMALVVSYVGQYNEHALGKKSGFQKGDVIVEVDGHTDLPRETDLFAHLITNRKVDDVVDFTIVRGGERRALRLRMQK